MQTDQELEWPFELFVMDHKGKVYRLHSPCFTAHLGMSLALVATRHFA
jgi:hypothetical protein